jgi:tRNA(fMet)-specific endonuclease VapC
MVILDTDHMSLLQRGGPESVRIARRLRALPPDDVATTVITYEEQMRGWLARLARANTIDRQMSDYAELKQLLRDFCNIAVVEFGSEASAEYQTLRESRIRIGAMDLKIASITLANRALLLTRNASDFSKVPGLKYQDWSV